MHIRRFAACAAPVLALALLAGCVNRPAKPVTHRIDYAITMTQGPDLEMARVGYVDSSGLPQLVQSTIPWTQTVFMATRYLVVIQLEAIDSTNAYPRPHLHCVIEIDGVLNSEQYGIGQVRCLPTSSGRPAGG